MSDIHKKLMILQRASIGANDAQAEEMMGEIEEAFAELQAKVDEVVTQLKAKVKTLAKLHDARFAALEEAEAAQTRVKELEAENERLRAGFLAAIERPKGVVPAGFEDLMKTE